MKSGPQSANKRSGLQWPHEYSFGSFVCASDKQNDAQILYGSRRMVVPVFVEGEASRFVAKILRDPLSATQPLKKAIMHLRLYIGLDENSREWRFLKKHRQNEELTHLLPMPLARGSVDGAKAILIERILWEQKQISLDAFARKARADEKAIIGRCIDNIVELFGRNHVVCNDIDERNIMVSDKSGKLSLVVIDGFGNNHLIPYPIFSKTLNARKIARRLNRTKQRLGLN